MPSITRDMDLQAESLYRIVDFRNWLDSNVLFPIVPDSVVHPLREHLLKAEHLLVNLLYDNRAIDKAAKIHEVLETQRRRR